MAQYTIGHACGHQRTHILSGSDAEHAKKADRLVSGPCSDCSKECSRARALAAVEGLDLPALTGVPKVAEQAEYLRGRRIIQIQKVVDNVLSAEFRKMRQPLLFAAALIGLATARADAAWWIEWRNTDTDRLLGLLLVDNGKLDVRPSVETLREIMASGGLMGAPALLDVWYEVLALVEGVRHTDMPPAVVNDFERLSSALDTAPPPTPGLAGMRFIPALVRTRRMRFEELFDPTFVACLLAALSGLDTLPLAGRLGDEVRAAADSLSVSLGFCPVPQLQET